MAGRFRNEDIAAVREKVAIDEVIGEHVQLRNAGGGNLKGICPFHDEKSPSLSVTPARGLYLCFGCGEGGDVIRFLERIEHLSFTDAVERLAARAGITLRYVEGGQPSGPPSGQRSRLVEAHVLAAGFYAEQLHSAEAATARRFLDGRGFDAAAARQFGCGYAPSGWDSLTKYLLGRGFQAAELTLAGLSRESGRGSLIDRFHRRLLWPIADVSGDIVGFGARRLYDDDKVDAKYLNTPDTPIYKKSQLLYGLDVAKREIAKSHRAVIVEGYTDVMACHLAGVPTAVATCGTAFGAEHVGLLRRLLLDNDVFAGEVIFTFDGDAAGMRAAEKAFTDDQKFMAQTFVAIEPTGKDPCDLRLAAGDGAVADLVNTRRPLVDFVLATVVARHNVESAEGRVAALNQAMPLVVQIKDLALRDEYARRLAGMVGIDDPNRVVAAMRGLVASADRSARQHSRSATANTAPNSASSNTALSYTAPNTSSNTAPNTVPVAPVPPEVLRVEREALKAAMQLPEVVGAAFDELADTAFLATAHRQLRQALAAAGPVAQATAGPAWVTAILEQFPADSPIRSAVQALAVEPLKARAAEQNRYATAVVRSIAEQVVERQIAEGKSRMQRLEAAGDLAEASRIQHEVQALEQRRRVLIAQESQPEAS